MSNGKINGANMLASGKHAKVSTVTFLSNLRFRGQRSNLSKQSHSNTKVKL